MKHSLPLGIFLEALPQSMTGKRAAWTHMSVGLQAENTGAGVQALAGDMFPVNLRTVDYLPSAGIVHGCLLTSFDPPMDERVAIAASNQLDVLPQPQSAWAIIPASAAFTPTGIPAYKVRTPASPAGELSVPSSSGMARH